MGEHKTKTAIKGDGYKKIQAVKPQSWLVKPAMMKDKWFIRHGYKKSENGKWVKVFK